MFFTSAGAVAVWPPSSKNTVGKVQLWHGETPAVSRKAGRGGARHAGKDHVKLFAASGATTRLSRFVYSLHLSAGMRLMASGACGSFGLRLPGRVTTDTAPMHEGYTGHELDADTGLHYAGAPQEYFPRG